VSSESVETRRNDAVSPEYWASVRPVEPAVSSSTDTRTSGFQDDLLRQLNEQGYCRLESQLDKDRISWLARLVDSVREAGWPAVFAFVYDDFWSLAWDPPIRRVAETALGGPVFLIPNLAVHYVSVSAKARGWHPHVDGRGRARRLTTWVPLTDATLANGCMYVVPKPEKEGLLQTALARYAEKELSFLDVQCLLQHARAVPASVGSLLCWGFELLHWGSVRQDSPAPRVSVAFEWIARSEQPRNDDLPLLDLDQGLPSLDDRLRFISRAIRRYEDFDPALSRFTELGKDLLARLDG
jgi:hypothetical protein